MTDLYLIAHKVRGEPAFDVATRVDCPECGGSGCSECDSLGYWWIIPTSGHRAYPYWDKPLYEHYISLLPDGNLAWSESQEAIVDGLIPEMPPDLPDHYPTRSEPKLDLAELLGFRKPKTTTAPFPRRI